MRRFVFPLLCSTLALALAGCSEPNPYPRVDFPPTAGNYIQFYQDGRVAIVELAKVDAAGKATTLKSSLERGFKFEAGLNQQAAIFEECGVRLPFRDHGNSVITATPMVLSEVAKKACPLGALPAQWQLVSPPAGGRND